MCLQQIRQRAAQQMMHQRAEILVDSATQDEFGATSYTTTVAARWPCRVVHAVTRARDEVIASENRAKADWHILLPLTAQVTAKDRIRIGGANGQIYLVVDTDRGAADSAYLLVYARTER